MGNDVVDLSDPRTHGKATDARFIRRILAQEEAGWLADNPRADRDLWILWACKEAAYKVASKLRESPPVFEHRAFHVTLADHLAEEFEGRDRSTSQAGATVTWRGERFAVRLELWADGIHALARAEGAPFPEVVTHVARLDDPRAPWSGPWDAVMARFTADEADPVHSPASAAVRLGARAALAGLLELDEARLEIVCAPGATGRRPPRVRVDGVLSRADVSLSHHGRWVAWAVTGGAAPG